jgi:hypothetical protein
MKFFFCLFCIFPLFILADSQIELLSVEERSVPIFKDEVEALELLIESNEKRIILQKDLRELMKLFQKQKEAFILGDESKGHAFKMVSNAREILGLLKEEHLAYLFSSDYLEELVFFSSIAGKSSPIRPVDE